MFCNEPLSWKMRSDAKYCSSRCRKAAHHAAHCHKDVVAEREVKAPPLESYDDEMSVYRVTWSSPIQCWACGRFTKRGFGSSHEVDSNKTVWACSWKCLRWLLDD